MIAYDSPAVLRQSLAIRARHDRHLIQAGAIECEHDQGFENIRLEQLPSGRLTFHGRCSKCWRALFLDRDGRGTERIEDVATYRAGAVMDWHGGARGRGSSEVSIASTVAPDPSGDPPNETPILGRRQ